MSQPPQQPPPPGQQPNQPQPYGQPYPQRPMPTAAPKSGGVAVILSFLIPGLGHLYTGNPLSAILWFVGAVLAWVIVGITIGIGIVIVPFVYLGAMIHAYISASNFNIRHHAIR